MKEETKRKIGKANTGKVHKKVREPNYCTCSLDCDRERAKGILTAKVLRACPCRMHKICEKTINKTNSSLQN